MKSTLRRSDWILLLFFAYIAALIPFFRDRPGMSAQPVLAFGIAIVVLFGLAQAEQTRYARIAGMIHDWVPMALTFLAFRGMEVFVPRQYNAAYERAWIRWDEVVLNHWHLKQAIEGFGTVLPTYLELCYLLVYGLGTFCIVVLWVKGRREQVDKFYFVLLSGTLLAYALFPYFPSRPPRLAFPEVAMPETHNIFRQLNLFLLRKATIHSGVFPSAHVSSAFAAAWGMFLVLPRGHRRIAWLVLAFAVSVTLATIYGRYHYVADAAAGFAVSLVAALAGLAARGLFATSAVPE